MKFAVFAMLALIGTGLVAGADAEAATVNGIRISSGPDGTRIVLDLSGPANHNVFTLDGPDRVVVDVENSSVASRFVAPQARGLVSNVRTGVRDGTDSRIVFEVNGLTRPDSFALGPSDRWGHRIVIDLPSSATSFSSTSLPTSQPATVHLTAAAVLSQERDIVVAVDAGHGGKDPGASGRRGTLEKDVVWEISRKLAAEINALPGFRAVLVRNGDRFVDLRERLNVAHREEPDFFVSIHADSYESSAARGATVYALSQRGATDEAAARLAARENAADLIGGGRYSDKEPDVASTLLDISQRAAIRASLIAGDLIIGELSGVTRIRKTTVQQARFVVLKSPDVPSILIETGYLTNPTDEANLSNSNHQSDLARAVRNGIVEYFYTYPLPGTYPAAHPSSKPSAPVQHNVSSGETLSGIADRYRISVSRIKSSNHLSSDRIRVGQVLTIPRG